MCSLFSDPEILAAFIGVLGTLFGALIGGVIGVAGTLMTVRQQAQIADRRDRESRLKSIPRISHQVAQNACLRVPDRYRAKCPELPEQSAGIF
jgi:hypothetical protein